MKNSKRDFQILNWIEATGMSMIAGAILLVLLMSSCGKGETYCEYAEEGVPCVWLDPSNAPQDSTYSESYKNEQLNLLEGEWRLVEFTYQGQPQQLDIDFDVVIWSFNNEDDLVTSTNKSVNNYRYTYHTTSEKLELWDGLNGVLFYNVDLLNKSTLEITLGDYSYSYTRI